MPIFYLSEIFSLLEMPHIETDASSPTGEGILDLRLERYPIPQEEKKKLFQLFKSEGFVGKISKAPSQFAFFSERDGVKLATPQQISSLTHLPDDWESYIVQA